MVVSGHVINGTIVLDGAVVLPEGAAVQISVATESMQKSGAGVIPTLLERLKGIVGSIDDLPADSSTNLDNYLYGSPKR
ncbi:MAG: hypothetical protein WD971_11720 [Pirellulales bacterium]